MPRSEDIYLRITGTHSAVSTSEETTLQFPTVGARVWLLVGFHYKVTAGGGTYSPELHQAAGASADGIHERLNYASTAVGTAINDVFAVPIPCMTDSNGRLYFKPEFDTGTPSGSYEFWFKKGRGATKTV